MKFLSYFPSKKSTAIFILGLVSAFIFIMIFGYIYGNERKSETKKPVAVSEEDQIFVDPICKNISELNVLLLEKSTNFKSSREVRLFNADGYSMGAFNVAYNKFNNARGYSCRFDKVTKHLSVTAGGGEMGMYDSEALFIDMSSEKASLINRFNFSIDNSGAMSVKVGDASRITHKGVFLESINRKYFSKEELGELKNGEVSLRVVIFESLPDSNFITCKSIKECTEATSTVGVVRDETFMAPVVNGAMYGYEYKLKNQTNNSVQIILEDSKKKIILEQKVEL